MEPHIKVGVSGLLYRGRAVLLGRRVKDDPSLPGQWCTPGGGVNFQERLEDALVREFKEETGLDVKVGEIITVTQRIPAPTRHSIMVFYRVYCKRGLEPIIGEGFDQVRWFTRKDILSPKLYEITDQTRQALVEVL